MSVSDDEKVPNYDVVRAEASWLSLDILRETHNRMMTDPGVTEPPKAIVLAMGSPESAYETILALAVLADYLACSLDLLGASVPDLLESYERGVVMPLTLSIAMGDDTILGK
jgi:hypothetical protein